MNEKSLSVACLIPPHYDYLCSTVIEGLNELGHRCLALEASNYAIQVSNVYFNNFIKESDIVLVFSGNLVDTSPLKYVNKRSIIAFVDGTDLPEVATMPPIEFNLIFKRELLAGTKKLLGDRIVGLQFGIEKRYLSGVKKNKSIKLSFVGSMSNFLRSTVHQELLSIDDPEIFSGGTGEIAYDGINGYAKDTPKYFSILQNSLASVDVPGRGWDCGRTWEIIGSGAALIKYRSPLISQIGLIEEEHYFGFSNLDELHSLWIKLSSGSPKFLNVAEHCLEFSLNNHTTKARAQQLLDALISTDLHNKFSPSTVGLPVAKSLFDGKDRLKRVAYRILRYGYNRAKKIIPTAN